MRRLSITRWAKQISRQLGSPDFQELFLTIGAQYICIITITIAVTVIILQ